MFLKIKKNFFLLTSTFFILYFIFNLLDGERGLFSYFKKKEILSNLQNLEINLKDYKGKLIIINFWATWCAPCREEMPSLDLLQSNRDLYNLKIFPINVGQENLAKSEKFFQKLRIKNLNIYYDDSKNLSKKFALRGIPTSIILNKRGEEFARILGTINFEDEEFINWLKKFN